MKKILNEFRTVAILSASIVFVLFTQIEGLVKDNTALTILLGTTTFVFLFEILLTIYKKVIWKIINHRNILSGDWEYTYDIYLEGETDINPKKQDKTGLAQIEHRMGEFSITANSYATYDTKSKEAKTLWNSTSYYFKDNKLVIGTEFSNELGTGLGFYIFHIIKPNSPFYYFKKPKKMLAHFMYLLDKSQVVRGRMILTKIETRKNNA